MPSYPINTVQKTQAIAMESLIVLENNLVLAGLVHRGYSKEYQPGRGSTVTIRIPTTFTSGSVDGTVQLATASEGSVNVVLDTQLDLTIPIGDRELRLDIVDFSEQFIQPIMRAHAQAIDAQIAGRFIDVAGHFPASSVASVSDITNLRSVMNILKVPMTDRRLVFHPGTEARYLPLDAFLHASKKGDGGKAVRDGEIGRVLGFDTYMDQNIQTDVLADGALTDLAGAASAATVGATEMVLYNLGTAQVLAKGDVFRPASPSGDQWFVLTAGSTLAGGIATVQVAPPVVTAIADACVVTFQDDHKANLAFHKNAFALVTAPLAPPLGGARAETLSYKGLSCRVVYGYEMMEKKNLMSIDILFGVKTLDRNLAARLSDAN